MTRSPSNGPCLIAPAFVPRWVILLGALPSLSQEIYYRFGEMRPKSRNQKQGSQLSDTELDKAGVVGYGGGLV